MVGQRRIHTPWLEHRDAVLELFYSQLVWEHGARRLHLFLAVPHGFALLLGHLWDRMPPAQLYEDLSAGNAYQPAFLIPN